ncbi:hypothetical protein ACOJQI_11580 [Bacillus salacetis]|uniref:hypothetical protein n=1 Tax=Bacillus salacetis TaxID=2315464 RepID=UPI003BA2E822
MVKVHSLEDLMKNISEMNSENSVIQFSIPGKGKFTLVLQEEDKKTIKTETEENAELKRMLRESQEQYEQGLGLSTQELLKSLSTEDFK